MTARLPKDFAKKNQRRIELIKRNDTLTDEEYKELQELQEYTAEVVDRVFPLPLKELERIEEQLDEFVPTGNRVRSYERPKTIKIGSYPPSDPENDE